jgi:RHS repeat-associated protein
LKKTFYILLFIFLVCCCYEANGNNTFEGTRTRIAYNEINLPQQVQLLGGRGIKNVYAADGRKLKSEAKQGSEYLKEGTKTYSGNLVFDINDELDYIIFPEGRIVYNTDDSTFNYEYHLKDHLGSTRVAFTASPNPSEGGEISVVQENSYYPFGAPINDLSWSPKFTNRYLREGKEYISDFDWNKYDFTGRTFDSWTLRALQVDPMAEKYYGVSPYALWLGNPLRVIDPTGEDIDIYYQNKDGHWQKWTFNGTNYDEAPKNQFVQDFFTAYNYNVKNGGGESMYKLANSREMTAQLIDYIDNKHVEGVIYWNNLYGSKTKEGYAYSPATTLEHEMDHTLSYLTDPKAHEKRVKTPDKQYENAEERRVITGSEAKTAQANGEFPKGYVRTDHEYYSSFRVSDPTKATPMQTQPSVQKQKSSPNLWKRFW